MGFGALPHIQSLPLPEYKRDNRLCGTFFHPDYTVGPGVSPDHGAQNAGWAIPPIGNGNAWANVIRL